MIVEVGVRNAGRGMVQGFIVEGYEDGDANGQPETSEQFGWDSGGPLNPGDTSFHRLIWNPGSAAPARLILMVRCPDDINTSNDRKDTTLTTGTPRRSVVVNEIMYAPAGDEPEWVEILNPGPAPVSLSGWAITDVNVGSKHPWARSFVLAPDGGSVVLCRDSASLLGLRGIDPGHVLPVAGFPSLNNGGDAVVIFDERAQPVDSVYYLPSWSPKPGVSLERIDALGESQCADNWGPCADSTGATPGAPNSIVRMDRDLSVRRLGFRDLPGSRDVVLTLRVRNEGRLVADDFPVQFVDLKSGAGPVRVAQALVSRQVGPGDSLDMDCTWEDPPAGSHLLEGSVEWGPDGRSGNNRMELPGLDPVPQRTTLHQRDHGGAVPRRCGVHRGGPPGGGRSRPPGLDGQRTSSRFRENPRDAAPGWVRRHLLGLGDLPEVPRTGLGRACSEDRRKLSGTEQRRRHRDPA